MESQKIECQTFRAVVGTGVSAQGALNLAHHKENCLECARFAISTHTKNMFDFAVRQFREALPNFCEWKW